MFEDFIYGGTDQPYIIAEIGSNHNGDMQLAKRLIDAAKEAGANAVKFQSWDNKTLISREEYDNNQKYDDDPKKHFGSLEEMVERYYLRKEQHYELAEYCKEVGIDFSSTPFSKKEVDLLVEIDVPFIKVASMDVNHFELLKYIAKQKKPVVMSTGMATVGEIEAAIRVIEGEGNNQIILLHCISIYPPDYNHINLNNIKMLKKTFGYPVGFSDHSIGTSIPIAAIAQGSCIVEKHFTIDKELDGWDHRISADPLELEYICREGANVVKAMGSYKRVIYKDEYEKRAKFRRSIIAKKDLPEGHKLSMEDFDYKRPGKYIAPSEARYLVGRTLKRSMKYDEVIRWSDFKLIDLSIRLSD